MIYTSENNWYSWTYDDRLFGRQSGNSVFKTTISNVVRPIGSFYSELLSTAKSTLDTYSNIRPCIFFSGGVDSEVMLRAYHDIGANPDVYIFRYEDDINIHDVSYAIVVCNILNVSYKIIDFNIVKFYENDAEDISNKAQVDRPRALPQLKFMDYCDGLPIYGASDLSIIRTDSNYSVPGLWKVRCWEHDIGWSKYARYINRPAVMEWFKWTPGIFYSYINTQWCKTLINDGYPGKLGTNSTKILGYREAYFDLIQRTKKTGFESVDSIINEFEEYLRIKNNGLIYRNTVDRDITDFYE